MEWIGRVPNFACPPVTQLCSDAARLQRWRAGRIVTADGRMQFIQRRWLPYRASRLRVWWDRARRPLRTRQCELYYHHRWANADFLVLGYVHSHPAASLASFYCATLVLDEIARLKGSHAIVTEVSNARLSDRLLERWAGSGIV